MSRFYCIGKNRICKIYLLFFLNSYFILPGICYTLIIVNGNRHSSTGGG
ncbi:hypothetical protein HMPREF3033_00550 [Veillonellaceae bacterium DNF00751]|uniref:Uncharacterized protein n=1 Tax=Megasphaera lornae TaxID=1000568 RepID=D3LUE4_9FIRM|nr:hypothetical protein HMPREF0889_1340 [Megasphaera genomosp. type_1 str. 28L]KXB92730.1 hypothetical protein HMPREF3033_00550 [Veillonellaceae bacterium DNF00751]